MGNERPRKALRGVRVFEKEHSRKVMGEEEGYGTLLLLLIATHLFELRSSIDVYAAKEGLGNESLTDVTCLTSQT